jgi:hypothetical protein
MSRTRSSAMLGAAWLLLSASGPADADIATLQQRLATLAGRRVELSRRLAAIEADPRGLLLLRAPVEIRDRAGHAIIFISKEGLGRGFTVFNEQRQSVAGADASSMVFAMPGRGLGGVGLGYDATAGPLLKLWSGREVLALVGIDGFTAFNQKRSIPTAQLSATQAEAGYLSLGDGTGTGMVEAGMLSKRPNVGVVRVYPYIPRAEVLLPITPYRIPNLIRGYVPK